MNLIDITEEELWNTIKLVYELPINIPASV
jgi:hypothetical protein